MKHRGSEVALLVGVCRARQARWEAEDSLAGLEQLARSAGARVAATVLQERDRLDPRYLIGKGKALEIRDRSAGVDLVILDEELSGSQQRNLERLLGKRVVDRTGLILDIFAQRAQTREGKLQVELAQLDYLLPRLAGAWTHLERLGGGIGTRGPGETQLESDRRRIKTRMAKVRRDLEQVRRHRALLRRPRRKVPFPILALVGYTNAGKSSLLNVLTHANVTVQDQLFATLDPTLRRLTLPGDRVALLSDTVGFIRKIPHQLVAAFQATLEEIQEADVLLHVVDISHPHAEEQQAAVEAVLGELGLADRPTILVFNKVDRLGRSPFPWRPGSGRVATSAKTGAGLDDLRREIVCCLNGGATAGAAVAHEAAGATASG
ncbi:MAG: GTPase HflX [candidate division NC10 bacterium]|nr:GTPase HflX [candidate division NC10 bacterium]